jgi:predicted transcriptional regulator
LNKTTVRELRDKFGVKPSAEASARAKTQAQIRVKIVRAASTGPKTIPEIAEKTGLDQRLTAWYVLTLTRHGKLKPVEKTQEGYWRYVTSGEGE